MASRKDFIEIAEGCADAIRYGQVKKKHIDGFILTMSKAFSRTNNNFNYARFEDYVKERIWVQI